MINPAELMSISDVKKAPMEAFNKSAEFHSPITILNNNVVVGALVDKEGLLQIQKNQQMLQQNQDLLNDAYFKIEVLQRLVNDDGTRISDGDVRGEFVNLNLSNIEDEWA
ncbi:MAG: hypothetical protein LBT80_01595 [Lactobacillaceae bacterium]|jgi:hypothetical protein|nr:hypothetical protein [Lactobacillaceae bacterium]